MTRRSNKQPDQQGGHSASQSGASPTGHQTAASSQIARLPTRSGTPGRLIAFGNTCSPDSTQTFYAPDEGVSSVTGNRALSGGEQIFGLEYGSKKDLEHRRETHSRGRGRWWQPPKRRRWLQLPASDGEVDPTSEGETGSRKGASELPDSETESPNELPPDSIALCDLPTDDRPREGAFGSTTGPDQGSAAPHVPATTSKCRHGVRHPARLTVAQGKAIQPNKADVVKFTLLSSVETIARGKDPSRPLDTRLERKVLVSR